MDMVKIHQYKVMDSLDTSLSSEIAKTRRGLVLSPDEINYYSIKGIHIDPFIKRRNNDKALHLNAENRLSIVK
jgi:hypothetical protein